MANDLSNSAAKAQAMRAYDDRPRASTQPPAPAPAQIQAESAAASAIAKARQSSATPAALAQRQPEAASGTSWGRAPAGVDSTASYERNRRIQAERLADERQRDLDEANARAYRAQTQQAVPSPRPFDSAPLGMNRSMVGAGVGVAAGAVAGAVLATAASADAAESTPSGDFSGSADSVEMSAGPGGSSTGMSPPARAALPMAPTKAQGSDTGFWIVLISTVAIAAGMFFWVRHRLPAAKAGRYSL
ncbi:MAG: hypothetical protein ACK59X_05630 [Acidovorax sp.]